MRLEWSGRDSTLLPGNVLVDGHIRPTSQTVVIDEYKEKARDPDDRERLGDVATGLDGRIITAEAITGLSALEDASIDCIYIDPPFNTGRDFGDYADGLEDHLWTTLLRDRIEDAHRVLRPTGSLWIHLDHRSCALARVLCDEIFGTENFLAEMIWQKNRTRANSSKKISTQTDPIIAYRKGPDFRVRREDAAPDLTEQRPTPDGDPRPWTSQSPTAPGTWHSEGLVYAIINPFTGEAIYPPAGRHWNIGAEDAARLLSQWSPYRLRDIGDDETRAELCAGNLRPGVMACVPIKPLEDSAADAAERYAAGSWPKWYFTKGGRGGIRAKSYTQEAPTPRTPSNLITIADLATTTTGAKHEAKAAVGSGARPFATPKPEALIERILSIATDPGDVVLDFFAGSGATGAAAHKMGRSWILIEREERTVEGFIIPRMIRVISGQDRGGISTNRQKLVPDQRTLFLGGGSFTVETSLSEWDSTPTKG